MSGLPKYSTGGTIHVIINNQISFTTNPTDARADSDVCNFNFY
jgi:2-oxoglutarate dehydrogenase E1 component